jgi:hypothetical protein
VRSWKLEEEVERQKSTATITEPSIETSTATDRLTEALEQKLSHPATSPDFDLHAATSEVLKDIEL